MNKLFAIFCLIYLAGDPTLSMLEVFNSNREYIVAAVFSVIMVPWVVSQFDN